MQPIVSQFKNYGLMQYTPVTEQLRRTATRTWFSIEQRLREVIEKVSNLALDEHLLSPEVVYFYFMSCRLFACTDSEILGGIISWAFMKSVTTCPSFHLEWYNLALNNIGKSLLLTCKI